MRTPFLISGLLVATVLSVGAAYAQTSFTHTVSIAVEPISVIGVSGDPLPMVIDRTLVEGRSSTTDASTSYNLTTNVSNVFIEAALDFDMPAGTELWLTGDTRLGRSEGKVKLSGSSQPHRLVSSIVQGIENGRSLAFEFVVHEDVEKLPLQHRRVTLGLIDAENGRRQEAFQTVVFGVRSATDGASLTEVN